MGSISSSSNPLNHTAFDISSVTNSSFTTSTVGLNGCSDSGSACGSGSKLGRSLVVMASSLNSKPKIVTGTAGYVLEDVPHLTDYIPDLPVRRRSSLTDYVCLCLPILKCFLCK